MCEPDHWNVRLHKSPFVCLWCNFFLSAACNVKSWHIQRNVDCFEVIFKVVYEFTSFYLVVFFCIFSFSILPSTLKAIDCIPAHSVLFAFVLTIFLPAAWNFNSFVVFSSTVVSLESSWLQVFVEAALLSLVLLSHLFINPVVSAEQQQLVLHLNSQLFPQYIVFHFIRWYTTPNVITLKAKTCTCQLQ